MRTKTGIMMVLTTKDGERLTGWKSQNDREVLTKRRDWGRIREVPASIELFTCAQSYCPVFTKRPNGSANTTQDDMTHNTLVEGVWAGWKL